MGKWDIEYGRGGWNGAVANLKCGDDYLAHIYEADDETLSIIAAAPDLMEALDAALNFIENTECELGITLESGDKARAAIAKAKGETA